MFSWSSVAGVIFFDCVNGSAGLFDQLSRAVLSSCLTPTFGIRSAIIAGFLPQQYYFSCSPEGSMAPSLDWINPSSVPGRTGPLVDRSPITAQVALDFGREVFAVRGRVDSCKSAGRALAVAARGKTGAAAGRHCHRTGLVVRQGPRTKKCRRPEDHLDLEPEALALPACMEP
jgi:hypothetical protein